MCFLLVQETMGSRQQRHPQIRSQATSAGAYQHHDRERDCFKITEMDPAVSLLPTGKQLRRKSHFKWRYEWWGLCFQFRKVWLRSSTVYLSWNHETRLPRREMSQDGAMPITLCSISLENPRDSWRNGGKEGELGSISV